MILVANLQRSTMGYNILVSRKNERNREWIAERRRKWFQENGPCKNCGTWENLELDHIDPSTKITHKIWSWSDKRRLAELAKCQVLCYDCHKEKTRTERLSAPRKPIMHGTRTGYNRGCRCIACKHANRMYYKEYVKQNPRIW